MRIMLCVVFVFLLFACSKPEPVYEGKTLSEWIELSEVNNAQVRLTAIKAIGQFGPTEEAIKALVGHLFFSARVKDVKSAACELLSSFGVKILPYLVASDEFTDSRAYEGGGCTLESLVLSMGTAAEEGLVEAFQNCEQPYQDLAERVSAEKDSDKRQKLGKELTKWSNRKARTAFLLLKISPETAGRVGAKQSLEERVLAAAIHYHRYKDPEVDKVLEEYEAELILNDTPETELRTLYGQKQRELMIQSFRASFLKEHDVKTDQAADSLIMEFFIQARVYWR